MGNGASSEGRAGSERPSSRPHSAAAGAPRKQHVLANQAPRRSANSFRSPAAAKAAEVSRQTATHNVEAKSVALQRVAAQRRAGTNSSEEEALRAFTRNADPTSLKVLQLLQQAETVPPSNPAEKLRILRQCYPLLEQVPKERFDQLAVTVYQQEGDIYYQQLDIENAKSTFSRAITLAEKRVARQDTDMYMVLKRYVLAMIGMARIWYDHERDHQGFRFVDHRHPKVQAVDGATSEDGASSLSSLESSLTSDGDSVFSLNEAILRSMAPRPPRRQTGPLFKRVKVKAPHTVKPAQADREEEFVLHSRMTRELVASPCELLLLRCCEVVQIGHNAQSELLIPPQIELAQIYEDLTLYSRALLLVRRCLGILCSVYDYDHPWVIQLMQRADRLRVLLDDQLRNEMATKIQATWKMHKAMQALEDALGHPVKRHQWIPRKYRTTPDIDYLGDFVGDMPEDGLLGADATLSDPEDSLVALGEEEDPSRWAVVPQTAPEPAVSLSSDRPQRDASYEGREVEPAYPTALVRYAPTEHREGGDTFTAMVPNANVVGTTQDTQTDTDVQHTDYGDVLTVRTTTVTKTITEDLARSDDEEEEEEEEEDEDEESAYDEDPMHPQDVLPPAPPPLPTRREQPSQRAPPPLPPRPHEAKPRQPSLSDSPYADEGDDDEDDYPYSEDTDAEEEEPMYSSPRDTSTIAQPPRHPRQPLPPQSTRDGRGKRREQPPPRQQPPPPQQRRDVAVGAPRSSTHSTPSPPSPPPAPKPIQKTKQTQVQPRGQAAGTQTRSPPPPPPSQSKKQRQPAYSEVSVSSSTMDELPPPPAPKPVQKTKQTQVQPRGQAAGTQTRTPPHQPAPSPPQSASPPTTAPPPPAPVPPARRPSPMQRHVPPPPPPQRTTAGTQYDAAPVPPAPLTEKSLPPSSQRGRELPRHQPVVSPYTDDDIPSLLMREKPQRAAAPPQAPQKPQARPPQRPPSPVRHDEDDDEADAQEEEEEEQDFVEERRGEDATRPAPLSAPPRPYKPEVVHDSKREPFRDLVEPNERYPLDVNGAPVFLPPLPFRTGVAHNGAPQPLTKENGQLVVVRAPSRSGAPPQHGAVQVYNPRKIDANAQPGMPMTLPSPANGYPRQMQNAPLPQPQSRKVTRDHKIIKTRIVRTYRHDVASDSEDGAQGEEEEKNVFEHESGSSWETNGSVHWATSRSSSEDSGSARPITDAASSSSAATSPRKHPTTTSDAQAKKAGHATHTHTHTHTKAVTRRPKESSNGSTISPKANGGGSGVVASSAAKKPSRQEDEAPTPEVISSSVAHHVKHNRRSRTTTTVRHLDDSTEL